MQNIKILITGGHATPAIACIEELRLRGYENLVYVSQKFSILFDKNPSSEYKLITEQEKLRFIGFHPGKFARYFEFSSIIWWLRIPIGFIETLLILLKEKPKIILTFGSHIGLPFALVAKIFGIKVIAHEQTRSAGFTIKLIQNFADKVCYSWDGTEEMGDKFYLTGNPLRKSIFEDHKILHDFNNKKQTIFITGGNQGSHIINDKIFKDLVKLTKYFNIIHQTGSNTLFNDFEKALSFENESYLPKNYFTGDEFYQALEQADFVISRGGANTLCEIIVKKKKSLIIPIPNSSGNEQELNAKFLEELGLATVIRQSNLEDTNLGQEIQKLQSKGINAERVEQVANLHKNAPKKIIDLLEELIKNENS